MSLKLLPLPQAEWQMYYRISWTAFVPGIMEMMYPNGYSEAAIEHGVAEQKRLTTLYPDRTHFLKVVDTELPESDPFSGVVGVSQWRIFPKERSEEAVKKESEASDKDDEEFGSPPGLNTTAVHDFGAKTGEYRKKHIGRAPHVLLQAISTRPGHERRGVAALALAWGTKKADELHLPAYLEASAKAVELYKRFGFHVVDKLPFDATKHGYPDPLPHLCMKRPART